MGTGREHHLCFQYGHAYRAPLSSLPGCGLSVPTITGRPRRRGSCLRANTVVVSSLWREGHSITSHIRHPSVEDGGSALSHTSGISLWRGWALCPSTHWAGLPGSGWLLCNGWVAPQGSSPHDHKRVLLCMHPSALQLVRGSHPGLPSQWEQVESNISVLNMVMRY